MPRRQCDSFTEEMSVMTQQEQAASADDEANLKRFVAGALESGLVWGLKSDDGWAVCPSNEYEDASVYPFWSDRAEALIHCADEWSRCTPTAIDLDSFLEDWLPGMHGDDALVGTNWSPELIGLEVEPMELAIAFGADGLPGMN
jgi:hypothetical protein